MKTKNCSLAVLIAASLITIPVTMHAKTADAVYFNNNDLPSDAVGALKGTVMLAQNVIMPTVYRVDDEVTQHPVGHRDTLVLFKPESPIIRTRPLWIMLRDKEGKLVHYDLMNNPKKLPRLHAQNHLGDDGNYDYVLTEQESKGVTILDSNGNAKVGNIATFLKEHDVVKVVITDESNIDTIILPRHNAYQDKRLIVEHRSSKPIKIYYANNRFFVSTNEEPKKIFWYDRGWLGVDGAFDRLSYGPFWSARIPAKHVAPGMQVLFRNGGKLSEVKNLNIGADTTQVISNINIGMLTPPKTVNDFQDSVDIQHQYFTHIPASRMVVPEFEPVEFNEVPMPTGELYTKENPSPDKGGTFDGDMRHRWGKAAVSLGINIANYGYHSSALYDHLYIGNQISSHTSVGVYSNGVQGHGFSGGSSIATLFQTTGNEWSHELGHNYGISHFMGGQLRYTHNKASTKNSTWVWDAKRNEFLSAFYYRHPGLTRGGGDKPEVKAWRGMYSFHQDAESGGKPTYPELNAFTSHTPYTLHYIQNHMEQRFNLDNSSPTGFTKWNPETEKMEPYIHNVFDENVAYEMSIPQASDVDKLKQLFSSYTRLEFAVWNGRWIPRIALPSASDVGRGKQIKLIRSSGYNFEVTGLGGTTNSYSLPKNTEKYFVSDGSKWIMQDSIEDTPVNRTPEQFGVPVTTLIGFYDPEKTLNTYIARPLYGSWGLTYADQSAELEQNSTACHLDVTMSKGAVHKYKLHNQRLKTGLMNKFHVNIRTHPKNYATKASIFCQGKLLHTRNLEKRNYDIKLKTYEHGISQRQLRQVSDVNDSLHYPSVSQVKNQHTMRSLLSRYDFISFHAYNGKWTRTVELPDATGLPDGKVVQVKRTSDWPVQARINGKSSVIHSLHRGYAKYFITENGKWTIR